MSKTRLTSKERADKHRALISQHQHAVNQPH